MKPLNFLERKWHRKSDIMNARRWDLFQFAYFTTNLCTSPPWQMREERLILIPELWKRNKDKFQSKTLKKLRSLLKGAVSRLPNSFCFLCPNAIHAPLFAMKLEKIPVNDKITVSCQTKCVSQTSYQWLQTTKMNFEKLLGGQVFKNHNYNPFHSSSSISIPASRSICGVFYTCFKLQTVLIRCEVVISSQDQSINFGKKMERLICKQVESVHIPVQMNSNEIKLFTSCLCTTPFTC